MRPHACSMRAHGLDENLAAMHVASEHVVARARRREQHCIARERLAANARSTASSMLAARRSVDRHAFEHLLRSASASRPMSTTARARAAIARAKRREILPFPVAARDQHDGTRHAVQRCHGGADVRAFRIVVEGDAAHSRATFSQPVRKPAKTPQAGEHRVDGQVRASRRAQAPRARWPRCADRRREARSTGSSVPRAAREHRRRRGCPSRARRGGASRPNVTTCAPGTRHAHAARVVRD